MRINTGSRRVYFKLALLFAMLLMLLAAGRPAKAGDPYCQYYCYQYYIVNCPSGYQAQCQVYYQDCLSHC